MKMLIVLCLATVAMAAGPYGRNDDVHYGKTETYHRRDNDGYDHHGYKDDDDVYFKRTETYHRDDNDHYGHGYHDDDDVHYAKTETYVRKDNDGYGYGHGHDGDDDVSRPILQAFLDLFIDIVWPVIMKWIINHYNYNNEDVSVVLKLMMASLPKYCRQQCIRYILFHYTNYLSNLYWRRHLDKQTSSWPPICPISFL